MPTGVCVACSELNLIQDISGHFILVLTKESTASSLCKEHLDGIFLLKSQSDSVSMCPCVYVPMRMCVCQNRYSLEGCVEADGGSAVKDNVDAGAEHLHILWAEGQARLGQLTAHPHDLLVEVWVLLPHPFKQLREREREKYMF